MHLQRINLHMILARHRVFWSWHARIRLCHRSTRTELAPAKTNLFNMSTEYKYLHNVDGTCRKSTNITGLQQYRLTIKASEHEYVKLKY